MASPSRYKEFAFAKGWPSVTAITGMKDKPFLARWRGNLGNAECDRITKQAQSIGHLFENYVDHWFEDPDAKTESKHEDVVFESEEAKGYYYQAVQNWHTFAEEFKPKPHLNQQVVYSDKYKYIGTFDRTFYINDVLILGDWKATNQIDDMYLVQMEAYYRAIQEMQLEYGKDIKELWLCQFPKKEPIKLDKHIVKFQPDIERFEKGFLTLLEHWWWSKKK